MTKIDQPITSRRMAMRPYSPAEVGSDPVAWLTNQATAGMVLLAHADDGVIWGRGKAGGIDQAPGSLVTPDFERTALRPVPLQQARLFDANQEIFLWRVGEGAWRARTVTDDGADEKEWRTTDETQVLWGTRVEANADNFCCVADGVEGLYHTPPLDLPKETWGKQDQGQQERRLRLLVRHYLEEDEATGWQQISMSRLAGVFAVAIEDGGKHE